MKLKRISNLRMVLASTAAALVLTGHSYAEVSRATISVMGQHFATDAALAPRVSLVGEIRSESSLQYNEAIPKREFHLYSFYETDAGSGGGDYSLDADTAVVRIDLNGPGHAWIGRTQPLTEGTTEIAVPSTHAVGTNWVQNQSNPLTPRVSGWIGTGLHFRLPQSGLFSTIAYSPLYMPNSGPTLNLSEDEEARGSRFAKLPPLYYNLNNELLPMRYSVQTGSIKDIVLQSQFFVSLGHGNDFHRLTLMHWSAPSPNPEVATEGRLRVSEKNGVKVLVTAVPSFPRQKFLGARWQIPGVFFAPDFGATLETVTGRQTYSASLNLPLFQSIAPWVRLQAGWLHTSHRPEELAAMNTGPVQSAEYASRLVWGEISAHPERSFRPSLRVERHLTIGQDGIWLRPTLALGNQRFTVLATADILAGSVSGASGAGGASYFGTWQSLDSISMGARYQW